MTDYGHDLLFGTFVTPDGGALEAAIAADRAGLDLVTFQDHPYQPAFLDTWTLMSYVAAQTRQIRISANVLNLPLRPPAVLARAAASLDLLSGGRFELGIGAGAFDDPIVAMGGPRATAGERIEALAEAIPIIRDLWNTSAAGPVRHEGKHYRVVGAKRGPRPAHDIGVWVGAYKPKMLTLTGTHGDGWLPSFDWLPGGAAALPEMNARIDDAAVAAGRSPSDIRRLLNFGRFDGWAERLADLALSHGTSAFIVASDDPGFPERFAAEIVPAVRDMVKRERA